MPLRKSFRRQREEESDLKAFNIIPKGSLHGEVIPPPDKSISHRTVILASISNGKNIIKNFLYAEDPLRTVNAFKQMGIDIEGVKDSRAQRI